MYDGIYHNPHIMQTQYHPHGMGGSINPNVSIYKQPKISKKVSSKHVVGQSPPGIPHNGLFAGVQQPGIIQLGGPTNLGGTINNQTVMLAMMATDFKNTLKHNSSNHSIQTKKMLNTIRKPTEFFGGIANSSQVAKKGSGSYMSPYS